MISRKSEYCLIERVDTVCYIYKAFVIFEVLTAVTTKINVSGTYGLVVWYIGICVSETLAAVVFKVEDGGTSQKTEISNFISYPPFSPGFFF
jgi:nitrate reductase NapE component